MSQLGFVAAAMSCILETPVTTYDDYVASGYDVESAQILDLNAIHENPLMLIGRSDEDTYYTPSALILHSSAQPIQIFIKTLSGDSHAMFVSTSDTVLRLKGAIREKFGYDAAKMRLEFASKELQDFRTLSSYNIEDGDNIHILFRLLGGYDGYVVKPELLSPSYNRDFTNLKDDGTVYTRGRHSYKRPYGWKRIALNVLGKFGSDNRWLGCVGDSSDEWPVSFHGTWKQHADPIAGGGYIPSVSGTYGPGVYSSPKIEYAQQFSRIFDHGGNKWQFVIQNRVCPVGLVKNSDIWLTPDAKNIRPYGLCFKRA